MFIVKQEIIGFIEYIVDSDDPVNAVINLTGEAEVMNSTLDLTYTNKITFRKITEKENADPIIKKAIVSINDRKTPSNTEDVSRNTKRKKRTSGPVPIRKRL